MSSDASHKKSMTYESRDADGNITRRTHTYDNKGNMLSDEHRDADGNLTSQTIYTYGSDGNRLTEERRDADGNLEYSYTYTHDSNGKTLEEILKENEEAKENLKSFLLSNKSLIDGTIELDSDEDDGAFKKLLKYNTYHHRDTGSPRFTNTDFTEGSYPLWRKNRIKKLIEIVGGEDWFKGKSVLELACGFGHIGAELKKLGADVTFAEGRTEYAEYIKEQAEDSTIIFIDQDKPWELDTTFDLIIHWGVLYHLTNWERDLTTALKFGKQVCLETEVLDSPDDHAVTQRSEVGWDQAMHGMGTFPSAAYVERILAENGASFVRYDDEELDSDYHKYSWQPSTSDDPAEYKKGLRRFWMISPAN
tara:strand:+ start:264 stop:1352 length:1089 start_codon:yes stop_codon:yes gene_type:complete